MTRFRKFSMMIHRFAVFTVVVGLSSGCGKSQVSQKQLATSFQLLGDAEKAYAAGDFAKADELFERGLADGTVNADVRGDIRCKQALCKLKDKKTAEAAKCLDEAEQASAFGTTYLAARVELCLQQGDKAKAKEYFLQLQKADRSAKMPAELR